MHKHTHAQVNKYFFHLGFVSSPVKLYKTAQKSKNVIAKITIPFQKLILSQLEN